MAWRAAGLALGMAAHPAQAGGGDGEALLMRVVFADCLGFVRHGRAPFAGLPSRPAPADAVADMPAPMRDGAQTVELWPPGYVAAWGTVAAQKAAGLQPHGGERFCRVAGPGASGALGVAADGFARRMTARAAAAGLTDTPNEPGDRYSPVMILSWSEPGAQPDDGPRRGVSFSLVGGVAGADGRVDLGVMLMAGPGGGR